MQDHDQDDDGDHGNDRDDEDERGEDQPEYSIVIEYDDFLTRLDLDEILTSIDRIIEDELSNYYYREPRRYRRYPFEYWHPEEPVLSYVGITGVEQGSIILSVLATGAVATYVARRFKKGVDKSLFADELERSGRLAGDVFGSVLSRINDWAEQYVPKQREVGGKITGLRIVRRKGGRKR